MESTQEVSAAIVEPTELVRFCGNFLQDESKSQRFLKLCQENAVTTLSSAISKKRFAKEIQGLDNCYIECLGNFLYF